MDAAGRPLLSVDSHLEVTREGSSHSQCFCPHGGLVAKSSFEFRQQVRDLLRYRLRIAGMLLFGALFAFLLRELLIGGDVYRESGSWRVAHILVTLVEAVLAALLCRRCMFSLLQLRIIEVVMFGLPAAFLGYMQYGEMLALPAIHRDVAGLGLIADSVPWLLTLLIYGLFIPNSWRRDGGRGAVRRWSRGDRRRSQRAAAGDSHSPARKRCDIRESAADDGRLDRRCVGIASVRHFAA